MQIPIEVILPELQGIIIISLIIIICYAFLNKKMKKKISFTQYFFAFSFICYLQLLYVVFFGISGGLDFHQTRHTPNLYPLVCLFNVYEMGLINMMKQVVLNIIIMVPFGFLLPIVVRYFRSFVKVIFFTIFIATFVEVIQYLVGRSADIDDVIMNTIGGMIGYMIFWVFRRLNSNKIASRIV